MEKREETSIRKAEHIDLAFNSQVAANDQRFHFEPMLASHPHEDLEPIQFLKKTLLAPIWISSMTGGSAEGGRINQHLARACQEFGLGMGLGSCRIIMNDDTHLADFQMRKYMGDQPFYANLGIAQIEEAIDDNKLGEVSEMMDKLDADGLIVHINPLQEWMQPEGDKIKSAPIDTIKRLIDIMDVPLIIKEVGQGMGPGSLKALSELPIQAIEFAAHGGTNFSKLEMQRDESQKSRWKDVSSVGHSNEEMVGFWNEIVQDKAENYPEVIISGGIKTFLDGYYYTEKINGTAIYGQASVMLRYANKSYELLQQFIASQIEGLKLAKQYLKVK